MPEDIYFGPNSDRLKQVNKEHRMLDNSRLRIAIQKSGRLSDDSRELLARCGIKINLHTQRLIGLTGGVFNFVGGLGGITVPLVVGYLAQGYGFAPALVYISAVALIGALSYILMVGDVKRVG